MIEKKHCGFTFGRLHRNYMESEKNDIYKINKLKL